MKYIILYLFCVLCFFGCKTVETPMHQQYSVFNEDKPEKLPEADYLVKEIIKEKNDLYVIDLERSDSVFRIFSHFDGEKSINDVEIHINDSVRVELIIPSEVQRPLWEMMNPLDVRIEHFGVHISNYLLQGRPYNFKVRYCDDLNGRYLRPKKD